LVSASVNIENLMWKWSDYKSNWEKIFFVPPIRESGQNKAMFKGINRGSIAGINLEQKEENWKLKMKEFLKFCIKEECILPLTLAKILKYNLEEIWFDWKFETLEIEY
jgi:dihydroorotase-like cyclic amidohydrolase